MKLSSFLQANTAQILKEWDKFAQTLEPVAGTMSQHSLRDHAAEILDAIAADIDTPQSTSQELSKSEGRNTVQWQSAASLHGTLREVSGFSLVQLTAEFRALRASVLRLWLASKPGFDEQSSNDMVRFNESVDQALAESAITFSNENNKTRDTFLAILGHDLRTPISAISFSGELLQKLSSDYSQNASIGKRLERSSKTMRSMVNDLLEYSRTQIGGRIPITKAECNLLDIFEAAHADASLAYPHCKFEHTSEGDFEGEFDCVRIQQVIMNLLTNACQYHHKGTIIRAHLEDYGGKLVCSVNNHGPLIPKDSLEKIFSPLVQLPHAGDGDRPTTSLGLGLFIARQIVLEHEGKLTVESDEKSGTTFTIELPVN